MADRIILLAHPDDPRSWEIIEQFGERTGLDLERIEDGARFPVQGDEHGIEVVQTLTEIEPEWPRHLTLGDPSGSDG